MEAGTGPTPANPTDIELERPTAAHVEGEDVLPRYEEVETLREKVIRPAAARVGRSGVEQRDTRDAPVGWDFGGN